MAVEVLLVVLVAAALPVGAAEALVVVVVGLPVLPALVARVGRTVAVPGDMRSLVVKAEARLAAALSA